MASPILIAAVLVGSFTVTSYRSVPLQTDASPFYTSIGEHVCNDGIAVSQDLLKNGTFKYGDWVYIPQIGLKRVNDTMNARWKDRMDVWVSSLDEEKKFFRQFKIHKLKVYKVRIQ